MMLSTALHELIDYNYWARARQLQACAALSEEQFLCPLGASFPSAVFERTQNCLEMPPR